MVEGKTLLVLLLLGRCQHSATVPQPAKKGVVSAKRGPQSAHAATLVQQSRVGLVFSDAQARELHGALFWRAFGRARALAEELFSFLNIVFGSSLRPAFFFGSLNVVCSAGCDHDRMRGCLPLRCLPLSLQLPGARGDWVPQ